MLRTGRVKGLTMMVKIELKTAVWKGDCPSLNLPLFQLMLGPCQDLKSFIKPFVPPQRSVKKNLNQFSKTKFRLLFSLRLRLGREHLKLFLVFCPNFWNIKKCNRSRTKYENLLNLQVHVFLKQHVPRDEVYANASHSFII